MGAVDAFTNAFSLVLKNKRLYLLVLLMSFMMAPLGAYLIPGEVNYEYNQTSIQKGNVIIEEYGTPIGGTEMEVLMDLLKGLAVYSLIALIVGAIFEYGVTKGIFMHLKGEEYSLGGLLIEGLKHFPGVILVNFVYGIIMLVFIGVVTIPIVLGVVLAPAGIVLVLIGLLMMLVVLAFTVGLSSLAIPFYVEGGSIGAAFEAFGLAFRNVRSTVGFGALLGVGTIAIMMVASPIAFVTQIAIPENIAPYVSAFLQAPFDALLYVFIWTAGVAFYRELQRMEELKKVDEELLELGIEV
ncbi:hypothetical protein [Thermococcus sp. MAR1]|uniref:hypothetical protein n=1 Tax=Thermococcus sp. MAR1 TaxID=1638263 RepID=UPI00143C994C|nr:hypothetical protein [Thermococcus sp. MAR1]NJE09918.1 hypothetical protein [Thermococcus sp. MAR1]